MGTALESMLAARSIALVGASPRPGTFGQRMIEEVTRSPSRPLVHLVNPRYAEIGGHPCLPSLADLPEPADLVLLAVPDGQLEPQLELAAARGNRSALIFGNAYEPPSDETVPLRDRLAEIARGAGIAMCGAGCMGFINVSRGLRAIGYLESSPLPAGPVALVTHSGSVFSALLRARRGLRFSLAVSSGQELVTTTPAYLEYALSLPETKVLALVLEAMRDAGQLTAVLATAAERDIPVVLLTVGGSAAGQAMVAAHSGALAAADGGWEALARSPTPWSCSPSAAGCSRRCCPRRCCPRRCCPRPIRPPASPPCTTPAWSGPTPPMSPPSSTCRSPRSARPPPSCWASCWTPACCRPTRWTSGAPEPTPVSCSPPR